MLTPPPWALSTPGRCLKGVECFNPIHEPRKTVDSVLIVLIVVDSVLIVVVC